jgi:putative N6-adenine-specific DNA methylase
LRHTQYAAQVTKDAICDRFRAREGRRPDVDRHHADLRIHVHVQHDVATVSIDAGAGVRHRRGYREHSGAAPLQETIAAAVLELAQYDGTRPLLDPMCGSGTLLAEAALRATGAPVVTDVQGLGCVRLPGIGAEIAERAFAERIAQCAEELPAPILGCDVDAEVLAIARENLARVPGGEDVRIKRSDFREHAGLRDGIVVCNPPYGVRLGSRQQAFDTVRALGDFLKQKCSGSTAWLVLGDTELVKHVGLRPAQRVPVQIGGLDGRLVRYELF